MILVCFGLRRPRAPSLRTNSRKRGQRLASGPNGVARPQARRYRQGACGCMLFGAFQCYTIFRLHDWRREHTADKCEQCARLSCVYFCSQ
ncbi:hypothetical protein OH77DRAFT_1020258 [Trametes cingulata]|nr:hypothetical protein OH77DRAFT_1020258 [Trametes cingulata]